MIYESAPVEVHYDSHASGTHTSAGQVVSRHPRYGRVVSTGTLRVSVPEDAQVFVNDAATTSTGENRRYVSRGLEQGRTYSYTVRAEFQRDGETVTETKSATLTAGSEASLVFASTSAQPTMAEDAVNTTTRLTLHVPENAKVTLAGSPTSRTGQVREFATTRLAPGATWANYKIHVEAEVNGEVVTQQKTITLTGGEPQEVVFEFGGPLLATN